MPPRSGTRTTSDNMKSVPTVGRPQGASELPDSAFKVEAYTRELNVDRRDMSDVYKSSSLSATMEREMTKHHQAMRKTKAGPVQCEH